METQYQYLAFGAVVALLGYKFWKLKQTQKKVAEFMKQNAQIIDVRSVEEFRVASNPKSQNIPLDTLQEACKKLDKSKPIIVCCASGMRSAMAQNLLKRQGFTQVVNAGPWTKTLD